jgi:hypothetical protein
MLLPLLGLLLAAGVPTTAEARFSVGLGDQHAAMFDAPAWQALELKRTRYIVPWDYARDEGVRAGVDAFMNRARSARQDVLVAFSASLGCWNGRHYSHAKHCRAPSAAAYRRAVKRFDDAYPWVRTYSSWNEVNHMSQPTYRSPALAARYYHVLRKLAHKRRFRVMALDVLDTSNMRSYLRRFMRRAKGHPRLWGLHNYQDVNRHTSADTRRMLRTVPGSVWLTETGGIVQMLPAFTRSSERASRRTSWLFKLAGRYDQRRRGLRSKIARVYAYSFFGATPAERFDAGLVNPDGSPRPAYAVFQEYTRLHR